MHNWLPGTKFENHSSTEIVAVDPWIICASGRQSRFKLEKLAAFLDFFIVVYKANQLIWTSSWSLERATNRKNIHSTTLKTKKVQRTTRTVYSWRVDAENHFRYFLNGILLSRRSGDRTTIIEHKENKATKKFRPIKANRHSWINMTDDCFFSSIPLTEITKAVNNLC